MPAPPPAGADRALTADERGLLSAWQPRLWDALRDVVDFWLKHSVDEVNGGFFACLDRNGALWDTKKYAWLMGRQ